jgi:hypothetical protein
MPYSRRSLLRDSAILGLGGVMGASSAALYLKHPPKKPANSLADPLPAGISVFFAGLWLFCADAAPGWMRAITLDMNPSVHTYRYGPWKGEGFDFYANTLDPNNTLQGQNKRPHILGLPGYQIPSGVQGNPPQVKVDDLFQTTHNNVTFTFYKNRDTNGKTIYTIDDTRQSIRIISLPIPTQIIPTAFVNGSISDSANQIATTIPKNAVDGRIATTHIFEYPGATSWTFTKSDGTLTAGSDAHFHFHTVPSPTSGSGTPPSANDMFQNLLNLLLGASKPSISSDVETPDDLIEGPLFPLGICDEEAEITQLTCTNEDLVGGPSRKNRLDLPSCAGGSIGLGGDCC